MKNVLAIRVLLLGAAIGASAQVQPPTPVVVAPSGGAPAPTPVRVATIFGQNAIASTQEGQQASAALTHKFGPRKDEYDHKQAELQALRDQLKSPTLTPEARKSINQSIEAKNREVERLGEDAQAALEEQEGALMRQLSTKLAAVIQAYASRNGYAAVIDVSVPNGPVIWASPSIDITNEIVRLYDQAHPVAPALPSAPAQKK